MAGLPYGPQVLDHYRHPRNVGSFGSADPGVGSAMVGSPTLGEVLKLQIRLRDAAIVEARFLAFGGGSAIAVGSWLTQRLQGCSLDEALAIHSHDIMTALALPAEKMHSALLAEDAIRAAVADYTEKHSQ
ncbi:Nitrogen fixation NifU-like protein OS=Castellaniella defragrans OX=75697 GN=HNR28_000293 PE=3 SV=1 [Castellaniella defragrans]